MARGAKRAGMCDLVTTVVANGDAFDLCIYSESQSDENQPGWKADNPRDCEQTHEATQKK